MFDFVGKRRWFFIFSGVVIVIGLISMLYSWIAYGSPIKQGIEFSSGSMMTVRFEKSIGAAALRQEMTNLGHSEVIIQRTGQGDFIIRTKELTPEERDPATGEVVKPAERTKIEEALEEKFGPLIILDFSSVSATVSTETRDIASAAVAVASVGILLYITWAFRKLAKSFRYGICALAALIHNVIVVLGLFSILGLLFGIEIDAMFVTGILTVIGYSVNDTIVVFDRIRENMLKVNAGPLEKVVNTSIWETLPRSLNTVLTTMFVVLALYLFGGATIHNFVLVLLVGIAFGTYTSICIASPLVVVWERGGFGRVFRPLMRLVPRRQSTTG